MSMKCQCRNQYPGCDHGYKCGKRAGTAWSRYFCAECNSNRIIWIRGNDNASQVTA